VSRRQYLNLGVGELVAAATFAVVAALSIAPRLDERASAALWAALVPLLVILLQAGVYWLSARRWVAVAPMPAAIAAVYRAFRLADPVLLAAGAIGLAWFWPSSPAAGLLAVGVWAFGVVEYLNYFVVRLAYPARQWFALVRQRRTPRLIGDLRSASR